MNTVDMIIEQALRAYDQRSWPRGLQELLAEYAKNVSSCGQPSAPFFYHLDEKLVPEYQEWFKSRNYVFCCIPIFNQLTSVSYQVQITKKSLFAIYPEHSN